MKMSMAGGAAAFALAACIGIGWSVDTYASATDDRTFVTEAMQSNLAEIALAKLAQERSTTPEVKTFAKAMIADHGKLGGDLKALAGKKGFEVPDEPNDVQKRTAQSLAKLSGNEFDRIYATLSVDDHKKAIDLMRAEALTTRDVDLRFFAEKTVSLFEHHRVMAEKLQGDLMGATP
jgi:putative membrane protein